MKRRLLIVLEGAPAVLLVALAAVAAAYVAWSCDRGLDLTDEGYYLLSSRFPEDVTIWANAAHVYTAVLFALAGQDVVAARRLGLALLVGSAALLALGLDRLRVRAGLAYSRGWGARLALLGFVEVGTLLYYHLRLLSPSYNMMNAVGVNAGAGFLCLALAGIEAGRGGARSCRAALLAAGACAGVSFFAKFSSGVSLFLVMAGGLVLWPGRHAGARLGAVGLLGLGSLAWAAVHFGCLQSWSAWWSMLRNGLAWLRLIAPWHGLKSLGRYLETGRLLLWQSWLLFGGLGAGLLVALPGARRVAAKRAGAAWLPGAVLIAALGIAAWMSLRASYHSAGELFGNRFMDLYAAWLLLLLWASAIGVWRRPDAKLVLLVLVLGVMPLAGGVGTADDLRILLLLHLGPLFGVFFLLLDHLAGVVGTRWVVRVGTLVLGAFAVTQVMTRGLTRLHHARAPILEQRVPTSVGVPATELRLDERDSRFLASLRTIAELCGFRPGADVLAIYDLPGAVFALGGRSPGLPWWTAGRMYGAGAAATEMALSLVPRERLARAFLLRSDSPRTRFPDLPKLGLRFPEGYVLCGQLDLPPWLLRPRARVQLWRPRQP